MINVRTLILKLSDGDVLRSTSYGVYISQLIRFARASSYVADFNTRNKLLTKKLLKRGYRYHKLRKTFSKFYRRYYDLISKFQAGLKSLLRQGLSEPDFYGDLVYKLKKIVGSNNFSAQFIKIISHYKSIGYNIKVLQQTACLVVNPITVGNFAFHFNCTLVGRTSFSVVVDFLFVVAPVVGVCNRSMFCCALLYVHSSIAIILMGKRELIALLNLSSWCLVMVERLFLTGARSCLQFVIVVFPDHTHLLFFFYDGSD